MARFKVGDCVQLKHSNGPRMTVSNVSETGERQYVCTWFNKGDLKSDTFVEDILEPCSDKAPEGPALA